MTEQERADALKVVTSVITRCERVQPKFVPGTPQHTLLKNRIQALQIAKGLLAETGAGGYSAQELSAVLEPLASILRRRSRSPRATRTQSVVSGTGDSHVEKAELRKKLRNVKTKTQAVESMGW